MKRNAFKKKIFLNRNVNLSKKKKIGALLCPLLQMLRAGRDLFLTGHVSLAAHSPAIPGGQDHFPEGPGAPDPAARRLLLRL